MPADHPPHAPPDRRRPGPRLTARAVVVAGGDAEALAPPAATFRLLADAPASGGAIGVNTLRLAAGADGAAPHLHRRSWEAFYVLEGAMDLQLGGERRHAGRGDLVLVPPGLAHAFGAAPGTAAHVLVALAPAVERFGYFRHLHAAATGSTPPLGPDDHDRYDVHPTDLPAWATARRDRPAADTP